MQANTNKSTQQPQSSFKNESDSVNLIGKEESKASSSKAFLREVEKVELEESEATNSKISKELVVKTPEKTITTRKTVTTRKHSREQSPDSMDSIRIKTDPVEITNIDESPSDLETFFNLHKAIEHYSTTLMDSPQSEDKRNKHNFLINIINCAESYRKKEIPEIFPDFSILSDEELKHPNIIYITDQFISICEKRSCVSLDKKFLGKLSLFLKDTKCIEIYSGNGWLTDELKKKSVEIIATDNYSFPKNHLPFVRMVTNQDAAEAVEQFVSQLSENDRGHILACHPSGKRHVLRDVFRHIINHSNCAIIAIGVHEQHWNFASWNLPDTLIKRDITKELEYTPFLAKERVVMYSFETRNTLPEITPSN